MKRVAFLLALGACAACGETKPETLASGRMELPKVLREVSGIAMFDATTVACVQDEHGSIYLVDTLGQREMRTLHFGPHGDYEGLARAGDDWFVLRSDGLVLRLAANGDKWKIAAELRLPGGYREWESLCSDPERHRLLVMPKHGHPDDQEGHDRRPIFAIDLATFTSDPQPVLVLSKRALLKRAEERGIELRTRTSDKGKEHEVLQLACSEIAVVPGRRELLLLSAIDDVLLRIGENGDLLGGVRLDAKALPQPEGMAFLPDGRLLIASEGRGGAARFAIVPMP